MGGIGGEICNKKKTIETGEKSINGGNNADQLKGDN